MRTTKNDLRFRVVSSALKVKNSSNDSQYFKEIFLKTNNIFCRKKKEIFLHLQGQNDKELQFIKYINFPMKLWKLFLAILFQIS